MDALKNARRIVVKIGSALLVDDRRRLRRAWLDGLADDIAVLRGEGQEVLAVSSGAIALGRGALGLERGRLRLEESQAAAAMGQIVLAQAWRQALGRRDVPAAQLLLTPSDTEDRRSYLNARSTVTTLLRHGAVPVINENDTVTTEEIRFGDNDRLAARVAQMAGADLLVLLSDIDGLYTADPARDPEAAHIAEVDEVTDEIEAMAGLTSSDYGKGGMRTKLAAARIALGAGTAMAICDGRADRPLSRLAHGARATWFRPQATPRKAYKEWIRGALGMAGRLIVDDGAAAALRRGTSLLPAGVTGIEGSFKRGDAVAVEDEKGRELARGLVAYDAEEARRILGLRSADIEAVLGYRGRTEMIHRDDLVVT